MKIKLLKIICNTMNIENILEYDETEFEKVIDTCNQLKIKKDEVGELIGKGSYSTVFKAGEYVIKIRRS